MLPPVEELIRERPTSWLGLPVEWSDGSRPDPVFLGRFGEIYLFAARYPLNEALVNGEDLGDGFFVEYFIVYEDDDWAAQRLLQRGSITYSARDENGDYVPATHIDDPIGLSLQMPPAWKVWDAAWPTMDGEPMRFVGQVELPETWGQTAYLFVSAPDTRSFKIVEQDRRAQTPEEHYALED